MYARTPLIADCRTLSKFPWWFRMLKYTMVNWSWIHYSTVSVSAKKKYIYRVIHKSLRDFQPLRYSSRDGHADGEHVKRGRDTPNFCPILQVLDMSTLGNAADVNFLANSKTQNAFLFPVHAMFRHDCLLAVKPASTPWSIVHKNTWERFSTCWYAAFCCVCLDCCAAEF
jgi:hypothetical protein